MILYFRTVVHQQHQVVISSYKLPLLVHQSKRNNDHTIQRRRQVLQIFLRLTQFILLCQSVLVKVQFLLVPEHISHSLSFEYFSYKIP